MTYATSIIKAHLDHFLGEGWSVKYASFPENHYKVVLINKLTLDEIVVTDDVFQGPAYYKEVVAQVRLFFHRYPVGDSVYEEN